MARGKFWPKGEMWCKRYYEMKKNVMGKNGLGGEKMALATFSLGERMAPANFSPGKKWPVTPVLYMADYPLHPIHGHDNVLSTGSGRYC